MLEGFHVSGCDISSEGEFTNPPLTQRFSVWYSMFTMTNASSEQEVDQTPVGGGVTESRDEIAQVNKPMEISLADKLWEIREVLAVEDRGSFYTSSYRDALRAVLISKGENPDDLIKQATQHSDQVKILYALDETTIQNAEQFAERVLRLIAEVSHEAKAIVEGGGVTEHSPTDEELAMKCASTEWYRERGLWFTACHMTYQSIQVNDSGSPAAITHRLISTFPRERHDKLSDYAYRAEIWCRQKLQKSPAGGLAGIPEFTPEIEPPKRG